MPYTMNGIGTRYVGKKDQYDHVNVCDRCGYEGKMSSYETRLWFVLFFIPVIPLQTKMVLNHCPSCTSHQAMPLEKWRRLKEETTLEDKQHMRANPEDPDVAIEAHRNLFFSNQMEEALRLARDMEKRFAGDVDVLMHLGSFYESKGMTAESDSCFRRALNEAPDDKICRRAVGMISIRIGDLTKAAGLLSFMMHPGPNQDVKVLYYLAGAFQQRGDHGQALQYFRVVCRDFPRLARKDKKLREAIRRSEAAVGGGETMLPRRRVLFN